MQEEEKISQFLELYKKEGLNPKIVNKFRSIIKNYYKKNRRNLPWRKNKNAYRVFVSEVMLQQTQVPRVIEKYNSWITVFPDFKFLAKASTASVIKEWQGLGYNRRGLFLKKSAEMVVSDFNGKLPKSLSDLEKLPGIGAATARSIAAFAFNKPTIFIETNIRSVYIHFFFNGRKNVDDSQIIPLLEKTIDKKNASDWYNALMDYGTLLKSLYGNPNVKSKQYVKQSRFEGSNRQIRGMILRELSNEGDLTSTQLTSRTKKEKEKISKNLLQLEKEGFIRKNKKNIDYLDSSLYIYKFYRYLWQLFKDFILQWLLWKINMLPGYEK